MKKNWDYFSDDLSYSAELDSRLKNKVEMQSAIRAAQILNNLSLKNYDICDVGSGPGHYYPVFEKYLGTEIRYLGLEFVEENINNGNSFFKKNDNVNFKKFNLLTDRIPLNGFNICVSFNTLPHVPNIDSFAYNFNDASQFDFLLFRMLIGSECVMIKKNIGADFDNLFEEDIQYNNIYNMEYLEKLFPGYDLKVLNDFEAIKVKDHFINYKDKTKRESRISRVIGDKIFKGEIYMPWRYLFGKRK
jgi:hypothetical protein